MVSRELPFLFLAHLCVHKLTLIASLTGHMTQVLWRASTHVGCSEASKPRNGGGTCRIQVCRYARPGNCNMNAYKSSNRNWWKTPVMMDTSGCSPNCPPDGC